MKIILTILTLLYPLVVFYGLAEFSVRWVSLVLLLVFLVRFFALKKNNNNVNKNILSPLANKSISLLVLAFLLYSFIFNADIGLLFYPVIVNCALALVFFYSLINPPPIIERLARLTQENLPPHAVLYTRTVTKVWLGFFIFNGLVASYTALFSDIEVWTLYNGFIAYILMALLFSGEYLVRLRVKERNDN
ncbi:MAG: hypothetical protein OQK09_12875 [Colwellia sp.]|nr:hypothetical protein [Colwellia sp.]MCW8864260.1 hypothetical protein [Colwellia sp.]MCW9082399.1 hypothetical protein [Colwellia sp.]